MHKRILSLLAAVFIVMMLHGVANVAHTSAASIPGIPSGSSSSDDGGKKAVIPPGATSAQVKDILAAMDDTQVRRLLISELKKHEAPPVDDNKPKGLAGLIVETKGFVQKVKERFTYLFSGAASAPRLLPNTFRKTLSGDGVHPPGHLALGLLVVTVMWFGSCQLVSRRMDSMRVKIEDVSEHASIFVKLGRLFARALYDMVAVLLITLITLIPYVLIFNEPEKGRPVIFAWLAGMCVVEVVRLVARFILVPQVSALRFLPMTDKAAQYINRWVLRIAWIVAIGMVLSSLVSMVRGSELVFLLILAVTGFIVAMTASLLALWNKNSVAEVIRSGAEPKSLRYQLAGSWHVGAILYALGFWMFWVLALLVFGDEAMMSGVLTLLLVPLYLLIDWATQRLVGFAVEMASPKEEKKRKDEDDLEDEDEKEKSDGKEEVVPTITKFQDFLSKSFRVLVFAGAVFLLLDIWGVDLRLGQRTVSAGIDILLTLVLSYIFWIFISNYIESRLKANQPDNDGESGEGGGGPGGDRFSTLLHLVQKFIFAAIAVITVLIILSSLGVDIGPLIAGASVFGIAIGFGAQTLVKDIISGIFFLMDDAFRVGDYIIVGKAKGTVEEISVRSFKLRHHLGPLYTIPFGSIKEIQNMSRDWAIMKLQYLVPFDTNIQQVKKIIKKINKEIRAIPELNEFMLSDIKSQGVKAMEEYGMRMRVKFMTKPGGQFTLRKLVLAKMRKEFEAAGIEFAKPRVSVSLPSDTQLTPEEEATVAAAASKAIEKKDPAQAAKRKEAR